MIVVLVAIILIVVVIAVTVAVVMPEPVPAPQRPSTPEPVRPPDHTTEREQAESIGAELLSRRVQLDARRGALQGDTGIEGEFDRLLQKLQSGEISAEQFEQEKIRLLGG
jgi:hypothetical protein